MGHLKLTTRMWGRNLNNNRAWTGVLSNHKDVVVVVVIVIFIVIVIIIVIIIEFSTKHLHSYYLSMYNYYRRHYYH